MRDEKKIVLVMLEPSEEPGTAETVSASDSAEAAASLHTASRSRRSDLRIGRPGIETKNAPNASGAATPASPADLVRFQFVVIACLLRFPAVVPLFPAARGSVPGVRISGPLVATLRSGPRQENRVLLSLRSGAVQHGVLSYSVRFVRLAFRPSAPVFSGFGLSFRLSAPSAPPGSPPVSSDSESVRLRRPKIPVHHPGPASCSVRLLFVSFMVRISKFVFCFRSGLLLLVRLVLGSFSCPVQFISVRSLVVFRSF